MTLKAARRGRLDFEADNGVRPQPGAGRGADERCQPLLAHLVAHHRPGLRHVLHEIRVHRVALFYLGHIAADFAWYTLVSGTVAQGRRFLSDGLYRGFLAGCGVFLVGFGGYFAVQGVKFFLNS